MKANKVLKLLKITRPTLCKYVKDGKLKTTTLPGGDYNYDDESVYEFLNSGNPRKTVVYLCDSDVDIKAIEQLSGNNIHGKTEIRTEDEMTLSRLILDVQNFRVKTVAVMEDDIYLVEWVKKFQEMFNGFGCAIEILGPTSQHPEWDGWTGKELQRLVRHMIARCRDDEFKKKLFLVE